MEDLNSWSLQNFRLRTWVFSLDNSKKKQLKILRIQKLFNGFSVIQKLDSFTFFRFPFTSIFIMFTSPILRQTMYTQNTRISTWICINKSPRRKLWSSLACLFLHYRFFPFRDNYLWPSLCICDRKSCREPGLCVLPTKRNWFSSRSSFRKFPCK